MNARNGSLRCGELAQLAGVSPDTIRHYERIGILPKAPRSSGGYRMYGLDAADRVQLVRNSLQLGFSLTEISGILKVRDGGGIPCRRVLTLAEEKLQSLKEQIKELQCIRRYLDQVVRKWRGKLARTTPGHKASLLQSLAGRSPNSISNFRRRKH